MDWCRWRGERKFLLGTDDPDGRVKSGTYYAFRVYPDFFFPLPPNFLFCFIFLAVFFPSAVIISIYLKI